MATDCRASVDDPKRGDKEFYNLLAYICSKALELTKALCALCFCLPTKMLHRNASSFSFSKCSIMFIIHRLFLIYFSGKMRPKCSNIAKMPENIIA